ncbi:STAS domain-containing protein [Streptomyces sp. NPDC048304]|uniref:STAS domain-containing protein n=1 Tax=Streptomyces sp. NPDC048304 TaxID=3154820 RepID=UPI0033F1A98A
MRESLGQCLRDGIRTIDVDLTTVTFCDVTGLNAFLHASRATTVADGSLRLHSRPRRWHESSPSPVTALCSTATRETSHRGLLHRR